ncbi:hypothetical protein C0Q70_04052 [Pomacea canaliculata]|uniref:HTH psq-type domain-containing protein n=1 Tax=Pomacea canaliculata TaxID=400727 RepID=A0A2T7PUH2_POMCA|nr:hypothetical protein C0Q70_04052 [Pomacea canaliculata]
MGPKKKMMSIELKREIVEKHEQGVRVIDLARMYGRSTSMICSELKQELIKGTTPARGVTIISKLRTSLHEKMEKLLTVWVTEKQLQGGTLTQSIMCEKARAIYACQTCTCPRMYDLMSILSVARQLSMATRTEAGIRPLSPHSTIPPDYSKSVS